MTVRTFRLVAPLVLLGLAGLVWFEPWLPWHAVVVREFGPNAMLRVVLGLVCVLAALTLLELSRVETLLRSLLGELRGLAATRAEREGGVERNRAEAVRILIAALSGSEAPVRRTALDNLRRLTGVDLGEDPERWREWADREIGGA
jgi:hypothetical protein